MLLTRSPLYSPYRSMAFSFDLHVLSTPPAFVLSQDQTLRKYYEKLNIMTKSYERTRYIIIYCFGVSKNHLDPKRTRDMKTRPFSCLQRGYSVVKELAKKNPPGACTVQSPGRRGEYILSDPVSRPFSQISLFFRPHYVALRQQLPKGPDIPTPLSYRPGLRHL